MTPERLAMFLKFIRHDLRFPLVDAYDFISRAEKSEDTIEQKKFLADAKKKIKWMMNFNCSTLETFFGNPKITGIRIDQGIDLAIEYNLAAAEEKGITIRFEKTGILAKGTVFMVESVVRNLIANAVKFTPKGGVIEIVATKANGMVHISVTDSGEGIPDELLEEEKLFSLSDEKIRQGTNGEKGSGFGLFLCREFVEKMCGEIHVSKLEPNGTEFSFTVPEL